MMLDALFSSTYRCNPTIGQNISSKPKRIENITADRTQKPSKGSTTWNRPRLSGWRYSVQFYRDLETTNCM